MRKLLVHNPVHEIVRAGIASYEHAAKGDYRAAGRTAVPAALTVAAAIDGALQGVGAVDGSGATAAGAAEVEQGSSFMRRCC